MPAERCKSRSLARFVEDEEGRALTSLGGRQCIESGERGLSHAGGADQEYARPALEASAHQDVHRPVAAVEALADGSVGVRDDRAGIHREASPANGEVVVAAVEIDTAHLDDSQSATLASVLGKHLLQADHTVGDALELEVLVEGRFVVEKQYGAVTPNEELLESEDLSAIAQRRLCEQAHLRQRVEDDPTRVLALHLLEHRPGHLAHLDLGRLEHGVLGIGFESLGGIDQLVDGQPVQRPTVRARDRGQLVRGLR